MRTARVLILLGALAASATARASALPIEGFAAIVNDRVITIGEVMAYVQPAEQQVADIYGGEELQTKREEIYSNGLEALISRALILEEFEKSGGQIPERLVNDRVNEIIFQRFNNDRAMFQRTLIDQQITEEEWREEIRNRLIISFLRRQEVADRVKVSPFDVKRSYDENLDKFRTPAQVRLRVIVLNLGTTDEEKQVRRDDAVVLRGRLLAGGDFAAVARERSEGMKASDGGDWGWMDPTSLRDELRTVVDATRTGEISETVEVGDQIFIIRVDERKDAGLIPFEQVRPELEEKLRQAESERLFDAWIERLHNKHYVQVF